MLGLATNSIRMEVQEIQPSWFIHRRVGGYQDPILRLSRSDNVWACPTEGLAREDTKHVADREQTLAASRNCLSGVLPHRMAYSSFSAATCS